MQLGANRMPLPGGGAAVAVVSLAGALIGPGAVLDHLLAVTNLDDSTGARVHAALLHHFFELFASFGSHVVHVLFHPFGRVGHFLAVLLTFHLDLPQAWFDLWSGLRRRI